MPNMANIVVKTDADADVTFTALQASGGDKAPARWRLEDPAVPVGLRAVFELVATDNGPKTARRVVATGKLPSSYTDSTTGQRVLLATVPFRMEITLPSNLASAALTTSAFIAMNLLASALVKASLATGYAPTSSV